MSKRKTFPRFVSTSFLVSTEERVLNFSYDSRKVGTKTPEIPESMGIMEGTWY